MNKGTQGLAQMKQAPRCYIGIDLACKVSKFCVVGADGKLRFRGSVGTTREELEATFESMVPAVIAIEAGSVSRLVDDVLSAQGHYVVVANPRKVAAISKNNKKCDEEDAELLARLVRVDPTLLSPIEHRTATAHEGLAMVRARDLCVRTRTAHMNSVRGMAKVFGLKLPSCDADAFAERIGKAVKEHPMYELFAPMVDLVGNLTKTILGFDKKLDVFAAKYMPRAKILQEIPGVGPVTAVAFALAVDNPERFPNQRAIGAYFGLVPRRDQSGEVDKRLGITKAGDPLIRRLLTQCAHVILQARNRDCDLKRFGERLINAGSTNKKRAVTAVARKLAVQMLRVLQTGEPHDPDFQQGKEAAMADA